MKTFLSFFLLFFSSFSFSQNVDTAAVERQVDSLIKLSTTFVGKQDFREALRIGEEAQQAAMNGIGKNCPAYASAVFNLGRVYYFKGDYKMAEDFLIESKYLREILLDGKHPDYAKSLMSLALLYSTLGFYDKAEELYLEAKSILKKSLGNEHFEYAALLSNLALLYSQIGNYAKAEPLHLEAKDILKKALGQKHPSYAKCITNLAILYWNMGDYEKAESLYIEANLIKEKVFGKEHIEYAKSLYNLAILNWSLGNYEKSDNLYTEALIILKKSLGEKHLEYARGLIGHALLYATVGNYEKAEDMYMRAEVILESIFGKRNPEFALSVLNNLALLYFYMGEYDKAEILYLESISVLESSLGREHPNYIKTSINLANLYSLMEMPQKAEVLYAEAEAILESTLGQNHPDYSKSIYYLFYWKWRLKNLPEAELLASQSSSLYKSQISKAIQYLNEQELLLYFKTFQSDLSDYLSFAQQQNNNSKILSPLVYSNTLFYKGFLLQASSRVKNLAQSDTTASRLYEKLKSYRFLLSKEYTKPIAERQHVEEWEEKANDLEKELTRTVAGFGDALRQVSWQEVQQQLKPGEVAIEFVSYQYHNPEPTDSVFYSALVLRPGDASPQFVALFEERQLAALLKGVSKNAYRRINPLYTAGQPGSGLYELIWKPLEGLLKDAKTVYCSPSGLLHRLNLAAIPLENGTGVITDRFQLVLLGSTRQLVIPSTFPDGGGKRDAFIAGGIRYESDSTAIGRSGYLTASRGMNSLPDALRFQMDTTRGSGTEWGYLSGTLAEAKEVGRMLQASGYTVQLDTGYIASEEALKQIGNGHNSPRILHLATHGFFYPDQKETTDNKRQMTDGSEPVFKTSKHPMIRSGLILAAANQTWLKGKPFEGREDGILTAYEISQMNLAATELVVLSACETGLGDIEGNEGVYGLQRAFKIAGAKYLIMSLWQISDQATPEFMTDFYHSWLDEGLSIPEAFRATQQHMREKHPDWPYYWAGFVLIE